MNVALHRRHDDLAGGVAPVADNAVGLVARFLLFHERHQIGDRLLHHARGLHHLRQEHLSVAEQIADDVHARHQRTFDHVERPLDREPCGLGVGVDIFSDAVDQRVAEPLLHRPFAPGEILFLDLLALAAEFLGQLQQPLRRAGIAVEDDVLADLAQFRIDVVVDHHLPGIDDAHVHAGLDGMIQKYRMHRLAHRLVAAE